METIMEIPTAKKTVRPRASMMDVSDLPLERLNMPFRSLQAWLRAGFVYLGDVLQDDVEEHLRQRKLGDIAVLDMRKGAAQFDKALPGSAIFTGEALDDIAIPRSAQRKIHDAGIYSVTEFLKVVTGSWLREIGVAQSDINIIWSRLRRVGHDLAP